MRASTSPACGSAAELRSRIDATGRCPLGEFGTIAGWRLVERATALGLAIEGIDRSRVEYTIRDRATGDEWIVVDAAERERIALQLIAAGAKVIPGEAD